MCVIAFDVDGTLIDFHNRPRYDIINILLTLVKHNRVIVWSGGGKDYAESWVRRLGLEDLVEVRVKGERSVHVAFDDEDASGISKVWVPVRGDDNERTPYP